MSSSEGGFARWFTQLYAETRGFTALVLLLSLQGDKATPLSCSYVHVIGDEVAWPELKAMLDASGLRWDGVAIFPESAPDGGPVIDLVAKARLQQRIDDVTQNRMVLNEAGFFDARGRAIRIDPIAS